MLGTHPAKMQQREYPSDRLSKSKCCPFAPLQIDLDWPGQTKKGPTTRGINAVQQSGLGARHTAQGFNAACRRHMTQIVWWAPGCPFWQQNKHWPKNRKMPRKIWHGLPKSWSNERGQGLKLKITEIKAKLWQPQMWGPRLHGLSVCIATDLANASVKAIVGPCLWATSWGMYY